MGCQVGGLVGRWVGGWGGYLVFYGLFIKYKVSFDFKT